MATMTTATRLPSGLLSRCGLIEEIRGRLAGVESETERLRAAVRALPADADRSALLRQLERQAAVANELHGLLKSAGDENQD